MIIRGLWRVTDLSDSGSRGSVLPRPVHASCPSCRTPIVGPSLPSACPVCGEDLAGVRPGSGAGAVLVLYSPDGLNAEFAVEQRVGIGRHYDNEIVVSDREVSKRHAVVERDGDGYVLRDLSSSNGTFVNGRRTEDLRLRDGDEIRIGGSRIVFRSNTDSGESKIRVVQAPSLTQVLAAVRPQAVEEGDTFLPASEIDDLDTLKKDYERLRIAYRFHQEAGVLTEERDLYDHILRLALEWLPADTGVILVPDGDGDGFKVARVETRIREGEIQVSKTLIQQVAERQEGVLSADAITDQRFSAAMSMVAQGIRSVLAVPVISRETIRAIVYLDSTQTSSFTPKDLDILSRIATQAAVSLENAELVKKIKEDERTRSQLERFLSPALVKQAAKGELDLKKGGSLVRATVLFSDIRGFTSMSENSEPGEIVRLLNEHFEEMVEVVFEYDGVLDKFIGDAVMAIWGVPDEGEDDVVRAVLAAVEMQRRIREFNERQLARGLEPIGVGIGVNTGPCVVGNMGSSRRLEYTVIGDAVNVASRLCDAAGPAEIIVSRPTLDALGGRFEYEELPAKQMKGKAQAVPIFRVIGEKGTFVGKPGT